MCVYGIHYTHINLWKWHLHLRQIHLHKPCDTQVTVYVQYLASVLLTANHQALRVTLSIGLVLYYSVHTEEPAVLWYYWLWNWDRILHWYKMLYIGIELLHMWCQGLLSPTSRYPQVLALFGHMSITLAFITLYLSWSIMSTLASLITSLIVLVTILILAILVTAIMTIFFILTSFSKQLFHTV